MSEIVMPECMKQRRAKLLNATYEYFLTVLEMDRNEAALPHDIGIHLCEEKYGN